MAGYQGATSYQGYDENSVKRQRAIADALTQRSLQDRGAPVQHWTQGVARLAEALMARQAGDRADKAETAFSDNRKKAADMLINAVAPGDASMAAYGQYEPSMMDKATALASGSMPARDGFNGFTPEEQASGERNARLRALTSYMGDPMAAISADQVMNPGPDYQFLQGPDGAISIGDKGAGTVRQIQPGAPKPKSPIIIGNNAYDPETHERIITGETKPNLPDGWQMGEDGKPAPIPGYAEWYGKVHPDASGGGGQPPSGYRWNQNNELEPIPGGPAAKKNGPNGISFDQIRQEQSMADDWSRIQKDYDNVNSQYERAKALGGLAAKDKASQSAADLALIVTITKMLDPTSVAREGEVKLTQSSASLWQQAQNLPNQWQYGQTTLPPEQRAALLRMADEIMPSYQKAYQNRLSSVYETANAYGFDPKRTMPGANLQPFEPKPDVTPMGGQGEWNLDAFRNMPVSSAQAQQPRYKVGDIEVDDETGQKYRLVGDDDKDPNNWEPVR